MEMLCDLSTLHGLWGLFAYLKILNAGLPVEIFDMCCNIHGYYLKLISERFLMQFGCFLIIKKLYNDESTVQVFWLKTL